MTKNAIISAQRILHILKNPHKRFCLKSIRLCGFWSLGWGMRFALALWRHCFFVLAKFTVSSITQKSHSVKVNAFIYSKSTMCAKKQSKRCPWKSDLCALRRCETCAKKGLKILNGSHRFVFFYVAVITAGVLAFVLNMHTSVLPSFRPMTVPISFFKYILLSAELPRYASMFVIGRTHQSLSASLFAR